MVHWACHVFRYKWSVSKKYTPMEKFSVLSACSVSMHIQSLKSAVWGQCAFWVALWLCDWVLLYLIYWAMPVGQIALLHSISLISVLKTVSILDTLFASSVNMRVSCSGLFAIYLNLPYSIFPKVSLNSGHGNKSKVVLVLHKSTMRFHQHGSMDGSREWTTVGAESVRVLPWTDI